MLKVFNRKKKDNKGFTLVELVIVVAILAILVGILAPQYTKYVEKSRKAADASNLENLVTAFKTAASDGDDQIPAGEYSFTISYDKDLAFAVPTGVDSTEIKKIITSYAGENWEKTKLKSKKWTSDDGKTAKVPIKATLTVKNDGSVTVAYSPKNIKEQTNQ